jgi:hypothetical protein
VRKKVWGKEKRREGRERKKSGEVNRRLRVWNYLTYSYLHERDAYSYKGLCGANTNWERIQEECSSLETSSSLATPLSSAGLAFIVRVHISMRDAHSRPPYGSEAISELRSP